MSKKITLGKVSITPKGRWSPEEHYENLDSVLFEGSLWIARKASVGQLPTEESEYWKIALDGRDVGGEGAAVYSSVTAFLPDTLYLAAGNTIEIYNRQVCPDADKYNFKWSCALGRSYERKFSISASFVQNGTYPLSLEITDSNGDKVWSKNATLRVSSMGFFGDKLICPIGSTHTDGKAWLEEIRENLSEGKIDFVGNVETENGICHEGRSGWTTETYLTKAEEYNTRTEEKMENPFWDGRFSWEYYLDTYSQSNDAVQLFFGEADLLTLGADSLADGLLQMIRTMRTEGGSFPIFVVLPPCPGTQDGMAKGSLTEYNNYFEGKCKHEIDKTFIEGAKKIYETISESGYGNIFFVPLTQCFDSENNFPTVQVKLNPRSSVTKTIQSNATTPTDDGYRQMADVMFGAYCAAFNT